MDDSDAFFTLGIVHAVIGRPREAKRTLARAGDRYRAGAAAAETLSGVILPYETDHLRTRQMLAKQIEETWTQALMMLDDDSAHLARLPLLVCEGAWDEAWQVAQRILTYHRTIRATQRFVIADIAALAYARGDGEVVWQLVHEWLPVGPITEPGDAHFVIAAALQRLAAAISMDTDNLVQAHAWLEAHDHWMGWSGAVLGMAEGQRGWALLPPGR